MWTRRVACAIFLTVIVTEFTTIAYGAVCSDVVCKELAVARAAWAIENLAAARAEIESVRSQTKLAFLRERVSPEQAYQLLATLEAGLVSNPGVRLVSSAFPTATARSGGGGADGATLLSHVPGGAGDSSHLLQPMDTQEDALALGSLISSLVVVGLVFLAAVWTACIRTSSTSAT